MIEDTKLAKDFGADFALVLVPSYFHFAMDQDAIVGFFEEVCSRSYVSDFILSLTVFICSLPMRVLFLYLSTISQELQLGSMSTRRCSQS